MRMSIVGEKTFKSKTSELLINLNRLREANVLCDVTFKVDGQKISCHKAILAAYSKHFENKFTSGEYLGEEIELTGFTATTFLTILQFVYNQTITISNSNVLQIYEACEQMQINPVKDFCEEFINEELQVGNCLRFRFFALRYQNRTLTAKCENFILNNFQLVTNENEFKELSVDDAQGLLAMKKQQDPQPAELFFGIILDWVKYNPEKRAQFFERLLQIVDITNLPTKYLNDFTKRAEKWVMKTDVYVQTIVPELLNRLSNPTKVVKTEEDKLKFMVVGDEDQNSKTVTVYNVESKKWKKMKSTKYDRYGASTVKIKSRVYTAGGKNSKNVESFDLDNIVAEWQLVTPMKQNRWRAASAVLDDKMYTVGGWDEGTLATAEVYDPGLDKWELFAPLKTQRAHHALVSWQGCLYAYGGNSHSGVRSLLNELNSLETYDPRTGKWKSLANMKEKRDGLCGVALNNYLYAIGMLRVRVLWMGRYTSSGVVARKRQVSQWSALIPKATNGLWKQRTQREFMPPWSLCKLNAKANAWGSFQNVVAQTQGKHLKSSIPYA
ncbi:kelch-like protein 12 isoform X1 [Ciona intestinalis]